MTKSHSLTVQELPSELTPDRLPSELFASPHFFLLESSSGGRYTIAAASPVEVIEAREGESFFEVLKRALREKPLVDAPDLPFAGGWIGYLGYELYSEIEKKVPPREPDLIPKARFCYYDSFYLYDHQKKVALSCHCEDRRDEAISLKPNDSTRSPRSARDDNTHFLSNFTKEEYLTSIRSIKNYITAGDCYQVNLSQRFQAPITEASETIYRRLRTVSPAPYSAFLNLGDAQILSSSPEIFLTLDGRRVATRPIKGTRPRGGTHEEDQGLANELETSEKDRAELLMITDLERNDLGRVCRPGSIRVTDLRRVETYPQVHHLVSTIEGELKEGHDVVDLLRATFPGGSITGAPKVRAMQIIRNLEPDPRNVYCGAIGFISRNGKAQFNVAIRTMILKNRQAYYWGGGGIVADSDPEKEYEETLVKVQGIVAALR